MEIGAQEKLRKFVLAEVRRLSAIAFDSVEAEERGRDIVIRCPTPKHSDSDPSCYVDQTTLAWKCFGCGEGGTLYANNSLCGLLNINPDTAAFVDGVERAVEVSRQRQKTAISDALTIWWREHRFQEALLSETSILAMLRSEGISPETAARFNLGLTEFPVKDGDEWVKWPAVAIPWMVQGNVRGVQLRLVGSQPPGGRYRWQKIDVDGTRIGGQPETLFNADAILTGTDDMIVVVEGAKKAMALVERGIQAVGVVNKTGWANKFAPPFSRFERVIFAPDPDGFAEFVQASKSIQGAVVARLPSKPDELVMRVGIEVLRSYLLDARSYT